MNLYLIRHGESEGAEKPDEARELTTKGLEDVEKVASHVTAMFPKPARIISSPFCRAIQTAEFYATGWELTVETQDWLLPTVSASEIIAQLGAYAETDLALVGHLPNLGLLLGHLVWGVPAKEISIPRGATALLAVTEWKPGCAKLRWLLSPDALD